MAKKPVTPPEVFCTATGQAHTSVIIAYDGRVLNMSERIARHTACQLVKVLGLEHGDQFCEACQELGYVEVTTDNGPSGTAIEACGTCDYFGTIEPAGSNQINKNAWELAKQDGYKLDAKGNVL